MRRHFCQYDTADSHFLRTLMYQYIAYHDTISISQPLPNMSIDTGYIDSLAKLTFSLNPNNINHSGREIIWGSTVLCLYETKQSNLFWSQYTYTDTTQVLTNTITQANMKCFFLSLLAIDIGIHKLDGEIISLFIFISHPSLAIWDKDGKKKYQYSRLSL